jgi:D-glycero-D-manno-heptose 1,7-bisphosphate phosphatase
MSGSPAVFFDRDGTLMEEVNYCSDPRQVGVYPGVSAALRRLKDAGFRLFIVTNQSGIGRGLFTEDQYQAVQSEALSQIGGQLLDASYYCPDVPGTPSLRRKPERALVLAAAADHNLDLANSYFIGDKSDDIECGRRADTRTILVLTGYGPQQTCTPDFRVPDVPAAADLILAQPPP